MCSGSNSWNFVCAFFHASDYLLSTDAVRRNWRTADVTDNDIQNEVVLYLHGAKDREGGKAKRMQAMRQTAEAETNGNWGALHNNVLRSTACISRQPVVLLTVTGSVFRVKTLLRIELTSLRRYVSSNLLIDLFCQIFYLMETIKMYVWHLYVCMAKLVNFLRL